MKTKLGELFSITSGGTPSKSHKEYYDGNIPWVRTGDLKEKYLQSVEGRITEAGLQNSSAKIYAPETVLLAMYGATIGAASILKFAAATNQACAAFICDERILPEYLYYFFSSQKEKFIRDGVGGAQPNISIGYLKKVSIDVPNVNKQREIITILGGISSLIEKSKHTLRNLDTLIKSRFIEMFGDPVTNPMGWEEHRLDEYITLLTSGSRGWSKYFSDNGEIFITIKNVKNNRISLDNVQYITPPDNAEAQRTKVREGDLLISITADLGRTGVVSKDIEEQGAYINQHLTCIRLKQDKVNPGYVSYFMESNAGKRQFEAKNQAAVKAGLNFDAIKSLKLLVPPLELQNEYMSFVEQVDKSKSVLQKLLEKQELLQAALMQEYFG